METGFGVTGFVVLGAYLVGVVLLGVSFTRRQKNIEGYFLAERSAPWWAVAISVVACDFSAISYMGSPAWSYSKDLRYPMTLFLFPLMAVITAHLFIPFLAKMKVFTIYEYLDHRFGMDSRLFASGVFLLQRAAHIAVATYAVSLALQQIVGWEVAPCVLLVGALTTLYTVLGGMKAVLWTDVTQFFVLVGSAVIMAVVVVWAFQGDVVHIWRVAADAGRTRMFDFSCNVFDPGFWMELTVWGIVLGFLASQVGAYGSDQVLVQRYLAAGSAKLMTRSLIVSGLISMPVLLLLNLLGLGFYAYYHAPENAALLASLNDLSTSTHNTNMVLPHFVRNVLPSGLAGLVFAGLFSATMSVFSSGLNSLSTATCIDFIARLRRWRGEPEQLTLGGARWITFAWGALITVAAIAVDYSGMESLVATAVGIIGFFSGPLLGIFLLGIFTTRANSLGVILGALLGFTSALLLASHVAFIWYSITGCVPTVVFGYILSYLIPARPRDEIYPMTIWGRDGQTAPAATE